MIADLSTNYVERHVLRRGHSVQRVESDYGFDLLVFTYDSHGGFENGEIRLQLKATDKLQISADGASIVFRIDVRDLRHWLREPMPVFLVIYDASRSRAFWLYVQAHFEAIGGLQVRQRQRTLTLRIPMKNTLTQRAVDRFRVAKASALAQAEGKIRHGV